jgi:WS/DGAT/MGAT family acyltransferase
MNAPYYERLSSLDHAFLALEGPTTCMHVAATAVLDAAPLCNADGGIDMERIRGYIASRLASIPRYRQRLAWIPVENHPVWVDDEHFDLSYHVRQSSLPKPGTTAQLQELCARLLERPLDRRRPLWEIWVIEGLAGGRFALHMKVHHCMVDGIAGVDLMSALFRVTPDTHVEPIEPWTPRPQPDDSQLWRDEVRRRARMSVEALSGVGRWLRGDRTPDVVVQRMNNVWDLLRTGLSQPAETPFNRTISPHRRVRWMTLDIPDVKEIKNQLDGTVNDVVLTTVAAGIERFLDRRGFRTHADLRLGVPVNLQARDGERGLGNHIWAWLVPVSLEVRGPIRRFRALQDATAELKRSQQALGGEVITTAFDWTSSNLMPIGARLLHRLQPYNLMVTNVPGPQCPLYLLGARIDELYPWVPLFENQGLAIALFSYDGKLFWSIGADWDLVPDVDVFVDCLEESFRDLRRAAGRGRQRRESRHVDPVDVENKTTRRTLHGAGKQLQQAM